MRSLTIPIQAGQLTVTVRQEELPLEHCLTYATRQNPKRLYLFVSKVLGKHWPVRPSAMRDVHLRLAIKMIDLPGPVLVIGMAETATALGRGVAEEMALRAGRDDILYLQTTRCRLPRPLAFEFDEHHSHAPDHAVYRPDPTLQPLFQGARSLILVDDEISTGRTLLELARAYLRINPGIEHVALACIANWLSPAQQRNLAEILQRPTQCPALIEGVFDFTPDLQFPPPMLPSTSACPNRDHDDWTTDPARTGLIAGRWSLSKDCCTLWETLKTKASEQPLAMIGTGEYAYTPFRIALALEEEGYDVRYQSTTRSPILIGDAIARRCEFADPYHAGIANYLYNLDPDRLPIILYEHPALPAAQGLAETIGGFAIAVEESCRAS